MRRPFAALLLTAAAAACAPAQPPLDTARLPPGVFSNLDQDIPAAQYAQYAFADASRTYGNPVAGAQAVIAMDYIAGQLTTSPRWANIAATTQEELVEARAATRAAVGIAPGAPSQLVVDSLNAARNDLQAGDQTAAAQALDNPAFPAGGQRTVQVLANLPYIQIANVATTHAADELSGPDQGGGLLRY